MLVLYNRGMPKGLAATEWGICPSGNNKVKHLRMCVCCSRFQKTPSRPFSCKVGQDKLTWEVSVFGKTAYLQNSCFNEKCFLDKIGQKCFTRLALIHPFQSIRFLLEKKIFEMAGGRRNQVSSRPQSNKAKTFVFILPLLFVLLAVGLLNQLLSVSGLLHVYLEPFYTHTHTLPHMFCTCRQISCPCFLTSLSLSCSQPFFFMDKSSIIAPHCSSPVAGSMDHVMQSSGLLTESVHMGHYLSSFFLFLSNPLSFGRHYTPPTPNTPHSHLFSMLIPSSSCLHLHILTHQCCVSLSCAIVK